MRILRLSLRNLPQAKEHWLMQNWDSIPSLWVCHVWNLNALQATTVITFCSPGTWKNHGKITWGTYKGKTDWRNHVVVKHGPDISRASDGDSHPLPHYLWIGEFRPPCPRTPWCWNSLSLSLSLWDILINQCCCLSLHGGNTGPFSRTGPQQVGSPERDSRAATQKQVSPFQPFHFTQAQPQVEELWISL